MVLYKLSLVLGEGLIFGLLALGVYVAFQWLRFPDLTPDGSFVLGAVVYVKAVTLGLPPILGIALTICAGVAAGCCTSILNRYIKIPAVVAGLVVSSALYSITWLILGKPNQYLDPQFTIVGDLPGIIGAVWFLLWLTAICLLITFTLWLLAGSIWGMRARSVGENPLLAHDLGVSESKYTFQCLGLANGLVALAGALFTQRSFSSDINMGIGVTIVGLAGMILGLLITGGRRRILIVLVCVLTGSILHKAVVFLTLEVGMPAEAFRLISATILIAVFFFVGSSSVNFLKSLKWN